MLHSCGLLHSISVFPCQHYVHSQFFLVLCLNNQGCPNITSFPLRQSWVIKKLWVTSMPPIVIGTSRHSPSSAIWCPETPCKVHTTPAGSTGSSMTLAWLLFMILSLLPVARSLKAA